MKNNTNNNSGGNHSRAALVWMMTSVITLSFVVFVLDWGETNKSPFLFAAFDAFFGFFTFLFIVIIWSPRLFSKKALRAVIFPPQDSVHMNFKLLVPHILSATVIFPLLSTSTMYIDIVPVAIIFAMSPLFFVLFISLLFRKDKRFKPLTIWVFILFFFGLTGFGFVTIGQLEEFSFNAFELNWTVLLGAVLALGASLSNAITNSLIIRHGTMAYQKIKEAGENIEEIYCLMISRIIQNIFAGIVLLIISFSLEEQFAMSIFWAAMITGIIIVPLGGTAFRQANLLTNNLGINALRYTAPFFSMLWLFLFRDPNPINLDFLIIGASAIIAANLLLNFEAEIRLAYKALILALWSCGTFVYLRQGIEFYDYFNLIEVAVVIFILVLSFRTDRLVRRTANEENKTLEVWHKISTLVSNKKIKTEAQDALLQIDSHKSPKDLQNAYNELKKLLSTVLLKISNIKDRNMLAEVLRKIEMLVHSKQQGINFGELTALFILTFITASGMLFLVPSGVSSWAGFVVEMFAFLLTSTVIFLFFNILDLQQDRNRPFLKKISDNSDTGNNFSIVFRDIQNRNFERWVSIIICISITLAYSWLLWNKWPL